MPSNTGGRSVNSGTVWPGTNSARSNRISIVDGATWTVTPRRWQRSTSSTARSCGKSGSAMITSCTRSRPRISARSCELAQRAQAVLRARRERDVADELHARARAVGERVRDRLDVLARPDEQRAALVAGLLEQPAGDPQVKLAQRRRCRRCRRTATRRRCSSSRSARRWPARTRARSPWPGTARWRSGPGPGGAGDRRTGRRARTSAP